MFFPIRPEAGNPGVAFAILAILATFPSALFAQWGGFEPGVNYASGNGTISVVARDLNGDGVVDLAACNANGNDVSIHLGNDDGTFGAATFYDVQTQPLEISAGDFDADNDIDLAVANTGSASVSVLLNNGDGTFGASTGYSTARVQPNALAIHDMDNDEVLDILAANYGANNVTCFLGDGDGTFTRVGQADVRLNPRGVAAGDFTGDGIPDILATNWDYGELSLMAGNENGTFQARVQIDVGGLGLGCWGITVADLNGDTHLDAITGNSGSAGHSVSVALGNGDGTFGTAATYPTAMNTKIVTTADFDGDGDLDIAAGSELGQVAVLLGDGMGGFGAAQLFTAGGFTRGVTAADFNGDGAIDLAAANPTTNNITVFLNSAAPMLDVESDLIEFGPVEMGMIPPTLAIQVSNTGTVDLDVTTSLSDSGGGAFAIVQAPASPIPPSGMETLEVSFAPNALGAVTGEVLLETNDPDNATVTVNLTGSGTDTQSPSTEVTGPSGVLVQESPLIDVSWSGEDNPGGSGLTGVELFYRRDGGGFQSAGVHASSPIVFDSAPAGGDGVYDFYTLGSDAAGNTENAPATPDVSVTLNDTTGVGDWSLFDW